MRERFRIQLKLAGYSLTGPRSAVFEVLGDQAYSMSELQAQLQGSLDRASLYRTIQLFERLQIIQSLGQGKNRRYELSDTYNLHHHHLNCSRCGKVETIEAPLIEHEIAQLAREHGFVPASHQLELIGLCRNCAKVYNPAHLS
jgi:Fur family ferric uptake transcriptional regulator